MKRKIIRVLEWNLNFGSYDNVGPSDFVFKYIRGFDIAILTEVKANKNLLNIVIIQHFTHYVKFLLEINTIKAYKIYKKTFLYLCSNINTDMIECNIYVQGGT